MKYLTYSFSGIPIAIFNTKPVSNRYILIDDTINENDIKLMKIDLQTKLLVSKEIENKANLIKLQKENEVKIKRNILLQQTDWTQLEDIPQETRDRYKAYRQALRDIPLQAGYPENVIWPEI
jgi:DNA polymerase II small subunit/DNA polymerase delta subunit B